MLKINPFLLSVIAVITICCSSFKKSNSDNFKTGDIVFIVSASGQGKALQLATKSKYTHVGLIVKEGDQTFVYHAVEPVKKSTFKEFMEYSSNGEFVVKRLKNTGVLNDKMNAELIEEAKKLIGKHYDIYFNWSDDEIYCSELVWKLYKHHYNLEIGKLRALKTFDLTAPEVKYIMYKRYGNNIPYEELMISPGEMFESDLLEEVK